VPRRHQPRCPLATTRAVSERRIGSGVCLADRRDFFLEQYSNENSREDGGERGLQYGFHSAIVVAEEGRRCRLSPSGFVSRLLHFSGIMNLKLPALPVRSSESCCEYDNPNVNPPAP
jgi:hypothetical protein